MADTTIPKAAEVEAARRSEFDFRNPKRLTKLVGLLLVAGAVLDLLNVLSNGAQYSILASHGSFDPEVWGRVQVAMFPLQLGLLLVTALAFLVWVYRANWNAHALGAGGMRYGPGWAVGWYFVPIFNLWKPYQVMREIWQVSANPGAWQNAPGSSLLGWWWALYLLHSAVTGAARSEQAETIAALMTDAIFAVLANLVGIALNLVAWRMLAKISANQVWQAEVAQVF